MPDTWTGFWVGILATFVLAVIIDRSLLWIIPRIASEHAIAIVRRRAGGVNRLFFHGLNTPANCRTPLSTADALMTLCPYDVTNGPLRIRVTIPEAAYWSICCYGPNADNAFAMNDLQVIERVGRNAVFVLHLESLSSVVAADELAVPLKSARGMLLMRTAVADPQIPRSLEALESIQHRACIVD